MRWIMMNIQQFLFTSILCVTGLTSCQTNEKNASQTIERMPKALLLQLSKTEQDPQMMFYLEQSVEGTTVDEVLLNSEQVMLNFINAIPDDKMSYNYGFGKWTVAEVLQHIISYEKIMTESALKIAEKKVENPFGNYSQSSTAAAGKGTTKEQILERFKVTRKETMATFASFTAEELKIMGTHEWFAASPRTLALCISGHQTHHFDVIQKRYLD